MVYGRKVLLVDIDAEGIGPDALPALQQVLQKKGCDVTALSGGPEKAWADTAAGETFDASLFLSFHPALLSLLERCRTGRVYQVLAPRPSYRAYSKELLSLLRRVDRIGCLSEKDRQRLVGEHGFSKEQVEQIVPWTTFQPYQKPAKESLFLVSGAPTPELTETILSCGDLHFDLIDPSETGGKPLPEELHRAAHVSIKNAPQGAEEEAALYAACSWVLIPFAADRYPELTLRAYAHSRPVLAYWAAFQHKLVDDGKSGFLVPTGNAAEYRSMLRYIAAMPQSLKESHSRVAYQYGKERFDVEKVGEKFH